ERRLPGRLVVNVDRVEIAGQRGEVDHVGLGHGPGRALPLVADGEVVETEQLDRAQRHAPSLPRPVAPGLARGANFVPTPSWERIVQVFSPIVKATARSPRAFPSRLDAPRWSPRDLTQPPRPMRRVLACRDL